MKRGQQDRADLSTPLLTRLHHLEPLLGVRGPKARTTPKMRVVRLSNEREARPVTLDDLALNIFTDGSSFSGPRAGGIGIRIITFEMMATKCLTTTSSPATTTPRIKRWN